MHVSEVGSCWDFLRACTSVGSQHADRFESQLIFCVNLWIDWCIDLQTDGLSWRRRVELVCIELIFFLKLHLIINHYYLLNVSYNH